MQDRLSHINTGSLHSPVFRIELQILHHTRALNCDGDRLVLRPVHTRDHVMIIDIFPDTADSVPAHLAARTVLVVHDHLELGRIASLLSILRITADRGMALRNDDDTVASDSEMTVGKLPDKLRHLPVRNIDVRCIDIDVIIACALHFCK